MIKRVILDIDDTLIPWKEEYYNEIKDALNILNIKYTEDDYKKIREAFDEYENQYFTYDRKQMIDFINEYAKKNYPEKLEDNLVDTLEYLYSKYEMVILTDWYGDQQLKRLEKCNIARYFKEIYSAEKAKRKPFKEAFMQAIGNNKPEECIMIGDNFERDIEGALNAGLQAIWFNPKQKKENCKCKEIIKMEELRNIL